MKIEYSQIRKRDFAQILENFLAAGHLVFSRPFPAAKQTCEMLKVWLLSCTVTYQRSRPLQQKSYQVSSLKEDNDNNKPTTNYNEQAFKMNICLVHIIRHDSRSGGLGQVQHASRLDRWEEHVPHRQARLCKNLVWVLFLGLKNHTCKASFTEVSPPGPCRPYVTICHVF